MYINAILDHEFISKYPVKSYKIALFVIKCCYCKKWESNNIEIDLDNEEFPNRSLQSPLRGNTKLSISFDIDLSTLIDVVLENNDSENINCEIWRYTESDVYILTVYILTYGLAILKIRNFQDDLEKQSA
ncbi:hypothetical protein RhiirA1_459142 [Rhizophagus irregularis]|uniref:Uncharacterized protein n=1 Tax=Rhizophagus irregularis TaxID=588596 RepID=A0A2N0RU85_9GLOM|nr:hypothetical protein RhiirA1_459142 [Rhizophagus irregularis]